MVKVLSNFIALVITVALACILYPVAAIFWIFAQLGKLSDNIFNFTNSTIKKLWSDIRAETSTPAQGSGNDNPSNYNSQQ